MRGLRDLRIVAQGDGKRLRKREFLRGGNGWRRVGKRDARHVPVVSHAGEAMGDGSAVCAPSEWQQGGRTQRLKRSP